MKRLCLFLLLSLLVLPAHAQVTILPPPVRNVTPSDMTPGPTVEGPLERVPAPPPKPRWQRFFLPETTDAATFKAGDKTIHVAGVDPPPVAATCPLPGGKSWPCGQSALYQLRMFLHGRAIECYFPDGDATDIVAPCRVGEIDIGLWLLSQGWARPNDLATDQYRAMAERAQCGRAGIWRDETPPTDCAAPAPNSG